MSGPSQTTSNKIDPQLEALYTGNYAGAQKTASTPYQPFTGQGVAPMTGTQTQAGGILGSIAANNPGSANFGAASSAANGVLGSNPSQVTAGQLSSTNLQPYLNPYQNDVINTTMAGLNKQYGQEQTADNQAATAANAFGGTRQAVQQALTANDFNQTAASTLAGLNSANYTQAQNAAMGDIGNRLNASEFNVNSGLSANAQKLQAAGLLGDLGQNQFQDASTAANSLLNYGNQQQQTGQAQDTFDYNQYLNQQQWPIQMQELLNQSVGLIPQQGTSSTSSSPGLFGILGNLF